MRTTRAVSLSLVLLLLASVPAIAQDHVDGDWPISGKWSGGKAFTGRLRIGPDAKGKLRYVILVNDKGGQVETFQGEAKAKKGEVELTGGGLTATLDLGGKSASGSLERDGVKATVAIGESLPSSYETIARGDTKVAARAPADVAGKYAIMASNAFSFFRGSAGLFYRDVAAGWTLSGLTSRATDVWLGGDMHLANLGVIPLKDKSIAYSLNDFDEGARGPYILDVQRYMASVLLAADANGISRKDALEIVDKASRAYMDQMRDIASGKVARDWLWTEDNARSTIADALSEGASVSRKDLLTKLTEEKKGSRRFLENDQVKRLDGAELASVEKALTAYIASIPANERETRDYYEILDVARKTGSGTGSLGLDRFWVMIRGKSGDPKDARILEWKEERPSAVTEAVPDAGDGFLTEAARVVAAERALVLSPDRFLGNTTIADRSFFVRELSAHKAGVDLTNLSVKQLSKLAVDLARSIAHAHAFSAPDGKPTNKAARAKADAIIEAAGSDDRFASALTDFSSSYVAKTDLDHASFALETDLTKAAEKLDKKKADTGKDAKASELVKALEKARGGKLSDAERMHAEAMAKRIRDRSATRTPESEGLRGVLERDMHPASERDHVR